MDEEEETTAQGSSSEEEDDPMFDIDALLDSALDALDFSRTDDSSATAAVAAAATTSTTEEKVKCDERMSDDSLLSGECATIDASIDSGTANDQRTELCELFDKCVDLASDGTTTTTAAATTTSSTKTTSDSRPVDESKVADHSSAAAKCLAASTGSCKKPTDDWMSIIDEGLTAMNQSVASAKRGKEKQASAQSAAATDPFSALLGGAATDESMPAELQSMFQSLLGGLGSEDADGDGPSDEQFEGTMRSLLGSFFDKDSLKEPVSTIAERYPKWVEANRESLSAEEYTRTKKQSDLYIEANRLLNSPSAEMTEIMDVITQTFPLGTLPEAVMDGMMPEELKPIISQMDALEKELDVEDSKKKGTGETASAASSASGDTPVSNGIESIDPLFGGPPPAEKDLEEINNLMKEMMSSLSADGSGDPSTALPPEPDMSQLTAEQREAFEKMMKNDCQIM